MARVLAKAEAIARVLRECLKRFYINGRPGTECRGRANADRISARLRAARGSAKEVVVELDMQDITLYAVYKVLASNSSEFIVLKRPTRVSADSYRQPEGFALCKEALKAAAGVYNQRPLRR